MPKSDYEWFAKSFSQVVDDLPEEEVGTLEAAIAAAEGETFLGEFD